MPFASFALPAVAALAGAAAVAVPVLIHLLSRQKVRVVDFAAVRFLLAAQKKSRRRVDQWVLLAARVLALLIPLLGMLAATAWAEPLWQGIKPGAPETVSNAPRTHYILVVDATASTSAKGPDGTRFDRAVRLAEKAVRDANHGDGFTLIAMAGPPQVIVPGPAADAEKVVLELKQLPPTHGTSDAVAAVAAVADAVNRSPRSFPRRQVLIFTDAQRSTWAPTLPKPGEPAAEAWQRVAARADVAVIDTAGADADNLAVVDVTLADPLPLADAPTAVAATLANFGRTDRKQVRVDLLVGRPGTDANLFSVEQRVVETVPAGGRAAVTFTLDGAARLRLPGVHVLQIKLADADDLPADDARSVAVDVRDGLPCLLVNGKPNADPLKRATEYLSEALAPGGRVLPGNPARPKVVSPDEFADAAIGAVTAADAVFLCDLPRITPAVVGRLEAVLKRGGGVVIGLGPNAAASAANYNDLLYANGQGLLPGKVLGTAEGDFRLAADEDSYRRPPLVLFGDENARGGLTAVPFRTYVKLDPAADGKARRVLNFVPAVADPKNTAKPDAAVIETVRHRGRVVVVTSTFNTDWNDWPRLPSFLPFAHELLRFAATNPDRHTVRVGEPLEEFLPADCVGLTATATGPDGFSRTAPVESGDESGVVRIADVPLSGLYRLSVPGRKPTTFAVNVPETAPGGGSESDLRRLDAADFRTAVPTVQVVADPADIKLQSREGDVTVTAPRPHGPTVARWLVTAGIILLVVEAVLAWRFGPGRVGGTFADGAVAARSFSVSRMLAWIPLLTACGLLLTVLHAERTDNLLGFLPGEWRQRAEAFIGVPGAGPGEGTHWRLESATAFAPNPRAEQWVLTGLVAAAVALVVYSYLREKAAAGGWRRIWLPLALRAAALLVAVWVVLPQLRVAFDREGWPDVAVILDVSASMGTVDQIQDPAVRAKAEELAGGLPGPHRLRLAQHLLADPKFDGLGKLLADRQVKVHLFAAADGLKLLQELNEPADLEAGRKTVNDLQPTGPGSKLGDAVEAVVKSFRGGSLTAVVLYTDGVVTSGEDLPGAGRAAARAGVPLYLVGTGDASDPLDTGVGDLRADEVVSKNDELVFEARVTARGPNLPKQLTVVLSERLPDGKTVERGKATVPADPTGKPVPVKLRHIPSEPGEKQFVIDLAPLPGEKDATNNRVRKRVLVTENRKVRVLFVEGYPRYEFRFVKVLLERETEAGRAVRSVDLSTLLLDASKDHNTTDRTALRAFPTRADLFEYDAVILGDADPAKLPRPQQAMQDLADFVRQKGGGLLVIAGEQSTPAKLFDTPLADVLPVAKLGEAPKPTPEEAPISAGYKPRLTPAGLSHPLFRFTGDDAANAGVWTKLKPWVWTAGGYRRKPAAEVLAVHPDRPAGDGTGDNLPLVVQQFSGAGRVLFFAADDTWRWRFRQDEEHFNTFWRQAVRVLSRPRITRAEVTLDRQAAYRQDEPIRVVVDFPDDAAVPESVRVTAQRATGKETETQKLSLSKVDGSRATFTALVTRTPPGQYTFTLTDPDTPGGRPTAEATVLPPAGELDRLDLDRPALLRAAGESRGKFYPLDQAEKLWDELPEGLRVPLNQPCPPVPVWNHAATFGLILCLLAAEWWVRRRERLV